MAEISLATAFFHIRAMQICLILWSHSSLPSLLILAFCHALLKDLVGGCTSSENDMLNEWQRECFQQFKKNIEDCKLIVSSDEYTLKWLVARSFDVSQAEKMLRQSIEWRRTNRIDEILDQWEPPTVLVKYYPMSMVGCDKFSCSVSIVNFGNADWKGIMKSVSKRDYLRYISYMAEKSFAAMNNNSLNQSNPVLYQSFIIDMEGLSMRQMAYKPFRDVGFEAIQIAEANYPESLRRVFIINAPKAFTFVFNMVKPFLHQVTLDKISVFGYDKSEWSAALLKEIDADQLPVHFGGSMTDSNGDPKCSTIINLGGEVPSSYYFEAVKPYPKSYMTTLAVPNGRKMKLEFEIKQVNSKLRWEFMTEEGDIGFRLYYVENRGGEKFDVVNSERIESHLMMEEGEIICTRPVLYVVEFDNRYSYLRSKRIWYRIFVDVPPQELAG